MYKFFVFSSIAFEVWLILITQSDFSACAQDHNSKSRSQILQTIEKRQELLSEDWRSQFITPQTNSQTNSQNLEILPEGDRRLLLATPDGFNPSLRDRDPASASVQDFIAPPKPEPAFTDYAELDNMKLNFQNSTDGSGQHNQVIEPTWQWRFKDGSVVSFQTGFNTFDLPNKTSVYNLPLQLGVLTKLGSITLDTHAGIDIYDRLPITVNFDVNASLPLWSGMTVSGFIEQKPYKSSANSLNNQVTTRRFGPTMFWQIDPDTSLFSLYRWGNYNDGNNEQQSFSRIERKFGQFSVAGNLFIWFYDRESKGSTYFSPPDFLVYSGEIAWEGDLFSFLSCRLAANTGEQRVNDTFSPARSFQASCTVKVSPSIEADLGYTYSNIRKTSTDVSSVSEAISGQLRVKF